MEISVIIPVYNRAEMVERTLDSVMAQTYQDLHVILVDNNSSDNSLDVLKRYASEHGGGARRFSVVQEMTPGASAARNAGARIATSEWIMFFDSDDEMLPDLVQRYVSAVENAKEPVDIVCGGAVRIAGGKSRSLPVFTDFPIENHIMHAFLSTVRYMVRKEYFDKVGGWDNSVLGWDDWELGLRLLLPHPSVYVMQGRASVQINCQEVSITGNDYSSKFDVWNHAIDVAEKAVNDYYAVHGKESARPSHERVLRYIDYKRVALAGLCKGEGREDLGRPLYDEVMKRHAKSPLRVRLAYGLIYRHAASGLRGASLWCGFF